MPLKIGIPRALLYYHYYPAWKTFFETLGAEVVLSAQTTKSILDTGVRLAVDEACLPVKLYLGHLADLRDKGVDFVFVPRMVSVEKKRYLCPKFLGLPEMARFGVGDLPGLLDTEINVHQKYRETRSNIHALGRRFTRAPWRVSHALREAKKAQAAYETALRSGRTPRDVLDGQAGQSKDPKIRVALLGHSYNLNDPFISMNLIERLREQGAQVITSEMLRPQDICRGAACLQKDIFWTLGKDLMGAAFHLLDNGGIDGLVLVASFGCGPDSLLCELVERAYRRDRRVPVLFLTLDEHTGEAGIVTRVEAFCDMLLWRRAI